MHPTPKLGYNLIIGRDLLEELGVILDFKTLKCIWDQAEVPMKPADCTIETSFHMQENNADMERIKKS